MTGDSQFCPIAKAAGIFCGRWTANVLYAMGAGATRFSELSRALPLTSRSLLARRLKQLEAEGILLRRRNAAGRGWTYHLTPSGRAFLPLVEGLKSWGEQWNRRQLLANESDIGLLLWDIESRVRADAFGEARTVVLVEFADQPAGKRHWWIVNEGGHARLCFEDPGFEVDLHLVTTLEDMTMIWRGELSPARALESGRLEALGTPHVRRALSTWLNTGSAGMRSGGGRGTVATRGQTAVGLL